MTNDKPFKRENKQLDIWAKQWIKSKYDKKNNNKWHPQNYIFLTTNNRIWYVEGLNMYASTHPLMLWQWYHCKTYAQTIKKKKKPTQTGFCREFLNIPTIKQTLSTHLRILAASSKRITTNSIYFEKNTVHKLLFAIIQRSDHLITTDCIIWNLYEHLYNYKNEFHL